MRNMYANIAILPQRISQLCTIILRSTTDLFTPASIAMRAFFKRAF